MTGSPIVVSLDANDGATSAAANTATLQAALDAASNGAEIRIAADNWTGNGFIHLQGLVINKSVTISGGGGVRIYCPSEVMVTVNANKVRWQGFDFWGNDTINVTSHRAFHVPGFSEFQLSDFYAYNFVRFAQIEGGFRHQVSDWEARDMKESFLYLDKNPSTKNSGVNGNDIFISEGLYDSGRGTLASVLIKDFDAVVTSDVDLIHGGSKAAIWINPQGSGGSSNHKFGANTYCDTTAGSGILSEPANGSFAVRNKVTGVWFSTCGQDTSSSALMIAGAGVSQITAKACEFHHNGAAAIGTYSTCPFPFGPAFLNSKIRVMACDIASNCQLQGTNGTQVVFSGRLGSAHLMGCTLEALADGWEADNKPGYHLFIGDDVDRYKVVANDADEFTVNTTSGYFRGTNPASGARAFRANTGILVND